MVLRLLSLAICSLLASSNLVHAQEEEPRIRAIVWKGVTDARREALEGLVLTRPGRRLDRQVLSEDVKSLWSSYRVRVEVLLQMHEGNECTLTFVVEEPRILSKTRFQGNVEFEDEKLREEIFKGRSERIHEEEIPRLAEKLRNYYRGEGFAFCEVHPIVDPQASTVVFEVIEGPKTWIRDVVFHGNENMKASRFLDLGTRLRQVMELGGPLVFGIGGSTFSERKLREDLVALRSFYRDHGYLDCDVWERERVWDDDRSHVTIHVQVEEGLLYRIGSVRIDGNEILSTAELESLVEMQPGDPYTRARVEEDLRRLREYYGERGFLSDRTLTRPMNVTHEPAYGLEDPIVHLTLRIDEGIQRVLKDHLVLGNEKTRRAVILRELQVDPGEIMDAERIATSLRRLQSTRYFIDESGLPAVRSRFREDEEDPSRLTWIVDVEEGSTGQLNFGGGIGSDSGPFLSFSWENSNFGLSRMPNSFWSAIPELLTGEAFAGDGQSLSFLASPGLEVSRFALTFTEPDLLGDHKRTVSFQPSLYRRLRLFRTHFEQGTGATVTLGKSLTDEFGLSTTLRVEDVEFDDIAARAPRIVYDSEGTTRLHSVRLSAGYRDVDVPRRPTRGFGARLGYELVGGPLGGEVDLHRITASAESYLSLGEDEKGRPSVLALQLEGGWAQGFGSTRTVPYFERWFLGGLGAIRGFDFRGVGPVANNLPFGGEAYWTLSAEYQFPLLSTPVPESVDEFEWIRGLLWTDWGALGLDFQDSTMSEVRAAAGFGLQVRLPPLPQASLDFYIGVPFLSERTDDERIFTFNLSTFGR